MEKNIVKFFLLLICLPLKVFKDYYQPQMKLREVLGNETDNDTPKGSGEDILDQKINTTVSAPGDVNDAVTVGSTEVTENPATDTGGIGTQELSPSMTTATDEQLSTKLDETTTEAGVSETPELSSSMTSATSTTGADAQLSTKLDETSSETDVSGTPELSSSMTSGTATGGTHAQLSTKLDGTEENIMTPNDISTINDDDTMTTSIESNVENTLATVSAPATPLTALQSTAATTTGAFTVAPTSPTVLETSASAAETTASTLTPTDVVTSTPTSTSTRGTALPPTDVVTSTPNSTSTRGTALPKRQPTNEDSGSNTRVAVGIAVPTLLVLSIVLGIFCYKKLKKTGRGYITLDDFGTFEGMNNPNYDGEL